MLAAFAQSPTGKMFGRTCERYGVDPGAILDDDVLAFNLRSALALGEVDPDDDPSPSERPFLDAAAR